MRALGLAFAILLMAPAAAFGNRTADFEFHSTGAAAAPGAVAGNAAPGTYEDFPFTIAPDEMNGVVTVQITWLNPADDWDMFIYLKNDAGELETVGSNTGAPPDDQATAVVNSQSTPVDPGDYIIRVQNYSASSPNFDGTVKFTDYVVPNSKPRARLKVPKKATAGKSVKLDASDSSDADGRIVNWSWDLDGDGGLETDGGGSSLLRHVFPRPGIYHVTVRVTDLVGARGFATRTLRVKAPRVKRRGNR